MISGNRGDGVSVEHAVVQLGTTFDHRIDGVVADPASEANLISDNVGNGVVAGFAARLQSSGNHIESNGEAGVLVDEGSVRAGRDEIAYNGAEGVRVNAGSASLGVSSIHDNWLAAIEGGRSNRPEVLEAHFDPSSGVTTAVVSLDSGPFGITQTDRINLYASPRPDPRGIAETPLYVTWELAERRLTVGRRAEPSELRNYVARFDGDLSGKFLTSTVVLFDWFAGAEIGPTSEISNAVQVTTDLCGTPPVPLLELPLADAAVPAADPAVFGWTEVDASAYDVWIRRRGEKPTIAATRLTTEAQVTLEPGEYEWWIEAKFDGCYSGVSTPRRFTVASSGEAP